MPAAPSLLDRLRVASPCSASWDDMKGDDRVRHCRLCQLNVYNLSAMDRAEAEALVRDREGRLCVRLFQREDGTVLTDNCPVGLRAARRRLARVAAGIAALFTVIAGGGILAARGDGASPGSGARPRSGPFAAVLDWLFPRQTVTMMMGAPPPTLGSMARPAVVGNPRTAPPPPVVMGEVCAPISSQNDPALPAK